MNVSELLMLKVFLVKFLLIQETTSKRSNVVVRGNTPPPEFKRSTGKFALPCPESHPYPYNTFQSCCTNKSRNEPECGGKTGTILGRDESGCCSDVEKLSCPHSPPCKMHDKGYERQTTHVLLIGSDKTLDFNIDPNGKVYPDRAQYTGGVNHGAHLMMAKEYPIGSGMVVACGGINDRIAGTYARVDLSLRECERYNFKENVWSSFPSTVENRHETGSAIVGGVLWFFGGYDVFLDSNGNKKVLSLDSTEFYDEVSGQWKLGPPLPYPMRMIVAIPKSDTEVLFFGAQINPKGSNVPDRYSDKVMMFDVTSGQHEYKAAMSKRRTFLAAGRISLADGRPGVAVAGGSTYADGAIGTTWSVEGTGLVEVYDIENNVWSTSDSMKMTFGKWNFYTHFASVDEKLWLLGGATNGIPGTFHGGVYSFGYENGNPAWTNFGDIPATGLDAWNRPAAAVVTVIEPR